MLLPPPATPCSPVAVPSRRGRLLGAVLVGWALCTGASAAEWEPDGRAAKLQAKAERAMADEKLDKARKALDKALLTSPDSGALLLTRARLARRNHATDIAQSALESGATLFPDRWECSAELVSLHVDAGALDRAAPHALDARNRGAVLPLVQAVVGWSHATNEPPEVLSTWLKEQTTPFAGRRCLDAWAAVQDRNPGAATVALSVCRKKKNPLRDDIARRLADQGLSLEDVDEVAKAAQPGDVERLKHARMDISNDNIEAAAQELDALVVRYPMDPELRIMAAQVDAMLGFTDQAIRELDAAAGLRPASLVGESAPRGVLRPMDIEAAHDAVGGATVSLVQLQLEAGDMDGARQTLARAQTRLGEGPLLNSVRARIQHVQTATP